MPDHVHPSGDATVEPSGAARWRLSPARGLTVVGLAALVLATGACGSGAATSAPVAGQSTAAVSPATTALRSAAHTLAGAADFTFASTVTVGPSSSQVAGQFQAPDIVHLTVRGATPGTTEVLFVRSKSYVRATDGTWQNRLTPSAGSADPRSTFDVVDTATSVAAVASATPGDTTFTFRLSPTAAARIVQGTGAGAGSSLTGTAVVRNGHLAGLTLRSTSGGSPLTVSIAYSAVGTTPPIPVPPGA